MSELNTVAKLRMLAKGINSGGNEKAAKQLSKLTNEVASELSFMRRDAAEKETHRLQELERMQGEMAELVEALSGALGHLKEHGATWIYGESILQKHKQG